MASFNQTPKFFLRLIHWPPQLAYAIGAGSVIGNVILLLTTIGRNSGKKRVTPLQYEIIAGRLYLAASLGPKSDWVRNIMNNPQVEVHLKTRKFSGLAEAITETKQIADFLELRLERHPKMIGAVLRAEGLSVPPKRSELEQYATQLTLIAVTPGSDFVF